MVRRTYQQGADGDTAYQSGIIAATRLFFENREGGEPAQMDLYSKDSDGTDRVHFRAFARGKEGSAQDQRLEMGYDANNDRMKVISENFGALNALPLIMGLIGKEGLIFPTNGDTEVRNFFTVGSANESLTLVGGVITATRTTITIDTQAGAGTDDCDTINGNSMGRIIVAKATSTLRTVVMKDGVGNLVLNGDFSMDHNSDRIILISTAADWIELSRSNNG